MEHLSDEADLMLEKFESMGILLTKTPGKLIGLHVNENWYQSIVAGIDFVGASEMDIDW